MLYKLLKEIEAKYSDKTALQMKRGEVYVKYSYSEMIQKALNIAGLLQEKGVKPGDRVALWGESIVEWPLAYLGIHFSGAVVVPLDAQLPNLAVVKLMEFCNIEILICSETLQKNTEEIQEQRSCTIYYIEPSQSSTSIMNFPEVKNFEVPSRQADDPMSIIFTSGTTGDPKGVVLTCENLVSNAIVGIQGVEATHEDNFLCVLPLHHCYAFTATFTGPTLIGATVTFQPVLQGPAIISAMQETKVSIMAGVPQLFSMFDRAIFDKIKQLPWMKRQVFALLYTLSKWARVFLGLNLGKVFFKGIHQRFGESFQFFFTGGAKLDQEIGEHFWNLGLPIIEGYGLTETSPVITLTPRRKFLPGSAGKPVSGIKLKVVNENEEGIGEIIMQGPNLMKGYYKNEQATKEVIKDGWFYTGDLGYLKKGSLYITGRAKEVIVLSSGKNVYPAEVEKAYETCDLIAEMCVMGEKKDDGKVDRLTALIVPDFDEIKRRKVNSIHTEIKFYIENISHKLPSYMRVHSFKIVSEPFPRTRLRKLKRKEIEQKQFEELSEEDNGKPQEISPEDQKLLKKPGVGKLLKQIADLAGYEGEIFPSDSLELDVGLESIKFMELLVILDQEYGLKFSSEDPPSFIHIRDILDCLPDSEGKGGSSNFSWRGLFERPCNPPLGEVYNLNRGLLEELYVDLIRLVARTFFRVFFRPKLHNLKILKNLKGEKPIIFAPNHQSYLDAMIFFSFMPRKQLHKTMFMAHDKIFSTWFLAKTVRLFRIIKTASSATTLSSIHYASDALKKGFSVCIFPEGARSAEGNIQDPMSGAGILACENQIPLYPVLIQGAMGTFSRPNPGFHMAKVSYHMMEPIEPAAKEEYKESDYLEIVNKWKSVMEKAVKEVEPR